MNDYSKTSVPGGCLYEIGGVKFTSFVTGEHELVCERDRGGKYKVTK